MSIAGKQILIGLTGGIACYKIPYLVRYLTKAQALVRVIMTKAATEFITPLTMETVSGNPVGLDMFPKGEYVGTHHIDLARWADLVVIAPATANLIGKAANGISDDFLTTILCSCTAPKMIAPAMNPAMWANPVTQRNTRYLKEIGFVVVGPAEGEMACDETGLGRMVEPDQIFEQIQSLVEFSDDPSPAKKKTKKVRKSLKSPKKD